MSGSTGWRIDDLDGGLSADLYNLSGLGNELNTENGAYNMSDVLNLPMFKQGFQQGMETVQQPPASQVSVTSPVQQPEVKQETMLTVQMVTPTASQINETTPVTSQDRFYHLLKAPTSPGKKLREDTLTYLNQGQSYQVQLSCLSKPSRLDGKLMKSVVKLGFYERKLQVLEAEKFEEWRNNRPAERLLEIDVPMSAGIHNIRSNGSYSNSYEFEWDTKTETKLYIIVNCVSSEFTKGKSGGESGVPLRLQIDSYEPGSLLDSLSIDSAGCQVKVFKPKGADRKNKLEMQKLENKSHDEVHQLQPACDVTLLTELPIENKEERSWVGEIDMSWSTPRSDTSSPLQLPRQSCQPITDNQRTNLFPSPSSSLPNVFGTPNTSCELSSESTVEETRAWLQANRFHAYVNHFTNYTGADLLRLARPDMIQIIGLADGIRLCNALQSRAARPLLTLYVSLQSAQENSGMKEYHAIFLEVLSLCELKKKLAARCGLMPEQIGSVYSHTIGPINGLADMNGQGPTGIYVLVEDEMVMNLMDEQHFVIELMRDEPSSRYRIILK